MKMTLRGLWINQANNKVSDRFAALLPITPSDHRGASPQLPLGLWIYELRFDWGCFVFFFAAKWDRLLGFRL